MLRTVLICLLYVFFTVQPYASDIVIKYIPNAQIVGEGRLRVALWDVYDATLYAPHSQWRSELPYALSIRYLRDIKGADIAERSIEEIKKLGFSDNQILNKWREQLLAIFPNVTNGTNLIAVVTPKRATHFYRDGKPIGTINDPQFTEQFFAIWLSDKTSEPKLRRQLLGQR